MDLCPGFAHRVKRQWRPAFTLVELLVVIGIIALLISILLPSLNKARRAAKTLKCEAALREIGNGYALYANDNRGWWPPAQLQFAAGSPSYSLYSMTYGATSAQAMADPMHYNTGNIYWFNFIGKYLTSYQLGYAAGVNVQQLSGARQSVLWGCPEWPGYPASTTASPDQVYAEQIGYGANEYPLMAPNNPALGNVNFAGNSTFITSWGLTAQTGVFYPQSKYTMPTQRALVADTAFWVMYSYGNLKIDVKFPLGMSTLQNNQAPSGEQATTFDWYRHGVYPKQKVGGSTGYVYEMSGGKVAFNILYCDNHVATSNDWRDSYRSFRMRYPDQ